MKTVSIIGIGRVGGALALALDRKGYKLQTLISRNRQKVKKISEKLKSEPKVLTHIDSDKTAGEIIFITTQDAEIENVAGKFAENRTGDNKFVFHTSGSLSSEVLKILTAKNYLIGSIHPLISVSDPVLGADNFGNAYFCIEGDPEAVQTAEKIIADLAGKSFTVKTEYKTLYHAAAVTACGHLVALIQTSLEMLAGCGLDAEKSKKILLPLINSTVSNINGQALADALTGTFARGDYKTLGRHIESIKNELPPEILQIYLLLGEKSLELAEQQNAKPENLAEMAKIISLAKRDSKC